jgi:hypothetical protein
MLPPGEHDLIKISPLQQAFFKSEKLSAVDTLVVDVHPEWLPQQ